MPTMIRLVVLGIWWLVALCTVRTFSSEPNLSLVPKSQDHQDFHAARLATAMEVDRNDILGMSRRIDELVEKQLSAHGEKPNPPVQDSVFLRRVYLDIIGRIPTMTETLEFLNSRDQDKRARLIDQLLDSDGYVSHQFNYWADLLRVKSRMMGGAPGQPYIDFIKQSLAENKPYDQFVRELLTAHGPALERGNGATGYYQRDFGMPEDNMSNTVRVFLGTRLECAQCHDHPFDKWTQREYFEMVAFAGGISMRLRRPDSEHAQGLVSLYRDRSLSPELRRVFRRVTQPMTYGVAGTGTGLARLPDNYQYDDGQPNGIVTAKTMFEHESLLDVSVPKQRGNRNRRVNRRRQQIIPGAREINSREAYAEWLTSAENPRFTLVIANRLWKKALGLGLIEPVDDLNDATEPSNPDLMAYLTTQMVELNYNIKQFLRAVYNTQTYQREATREDILSENDYHFNGPLLRRMSGEQLWDSLLTLAVPDIDQRKGRAPRMGRWQFTGDIYEAYQQLREKTPDELLQMARDQVDRQKNGKRPRAQMAMQQAGKRLQTARKKQQQQSQDLARRIRAARRAKDFAALKELNAERKKMMARQRQRFGRAARDLVRASELTSPARPGHFVREFGASDREQIDNSHQDPAVTQVLALMNGFIETRISRNPNTLLMKNVLDAPTPAKKIDAVFLSMLSRLPTPSERRVWLADGQRYGHEAVNDLIWTLANTSQFMFIQ